MATFKEKWIMELKKGTLLGTANSASTIKAGRMCWISTRIKIKTQKKCGGKIANKKGRRTARKQRRKKRERIKTKKRRTKGLIEESRTKLSIGYSKAISTAPVERNQE
jgi:hypothetical protein